MDNNQTDCGAHLITLITNQDHVSQMWVKLLITIETSLVVGLGFIVRFGETLKQWSTPWAVTLFSILGISAAIALSQIIVHERRWQAWYVQQFNKLPGQLPQIFPKDKNDDVSFPKISRGYISQTAIAFALVVGMAWLVVLVAQLWQMFGVELKDEIMWKIQLSTVIGLVLSILGTFIIIVGELKGPGSIIRQRWEEIKGNNWFIRLTCRTARLFGTEDSRDQDPSVVSSFVWKIWGFIFLFSGFVLQVLGAVKL